MNAELPGKPESPPTLHFPWGLPGLERYRRFVVMPVRDNPFFLLLQSEDEPDLGLLLVDPFPLFPDYSYTLTDLDRQDLKLGCPEDLLLYTTVSISPDGFCTNLAAPLAINASARLGKQLYLYRYRSRLRAPLVEQVFNDPSINKAAPGSLSDQDRHNSG